MKEAIRNFGRGNGADVVGFAAIEDYRSPRTPDPRTLLPGGSGRWWSWVIARSRGGLNRRTSGSG
jgi:hypothetical protein